MGERVIVAGANEVETEGFADLGADMRGGGHRGDLELRGISGALRSGFMGKNRRVVEQAAGSG